MTAGGCCAVFRTLTHFSKFPVHTKAQIPLGSSRHVTSRHDTFDVSSPCILAVSSLSTSTARHARLDALDTSNVSCWDVMWRAKWNLGISNPSSVRRSSVAESVSGLPGHLRFVVSSCVTSSRALQCSVSPREWITHVASVSSPFFATTHCRRRRWRSAYFLHRSRWRRCCRRHRRGINR